MKFCAVLAAAVLLAVSAQARPVSQTMPMDVEPEDAFDHLLTPLEPIYEERGRLMGIDVMVLIGPDGSVLSVEPRNSSSRNSERYEKAAGQAMTLRFRPFEQNGGPVTARAAIRIPVRTPPAWGVERPMPSGNLDELVIRMDREPGLASGPTLAIEIHGDGRFSVAPDYPFAGLDSRTGTLSPEVVSDLYRRIRSVRFFSLREFYGVQATDMSMTTVSVTLGRETKKVGDYVGEVVGMPPEVNDLEAAIATAVGVEILVCLDEQYPPRELRCTERVKAAGL